MKHVLITGGNKGIGLETTLQLLEKNYRVTVVARDINPVKGLTHCEGIAFDLQQIEAIPQLIAELSPIDVLINNAGVMNTCLYNAYPATQKDALIKINLEAAIALITAVAPEMISRKQGRIVNNASIAGHMGHPDIWYGISKAGLINATKSFAKLLAPHGILVNAVAPGPTETEMMQCIPDARKETILKNVYLGRFAQPEEVAKAIVWLATESPEYINGTCIDINNGAFPR